MSWRDTVLARWRAGEISREVALAQLLLSGEVPDAEGLPGPVAELARANAGRLEELAALARSGFDAADPETAATLFDRLAQVAPDAGVAFYTLGDPALMAAATAELVAVIRARVPVEGRDLLDYGCGTGRVARALAPFARTVLGVDVSAGMVARASAAGAGIAGLSFRRGDGRSVPAPDASVDAVVAADSFPFIVQAGEAVTGAIFGEFARVLRQGGDLLVLNWSYRGDPALDAADAAVLAEGHGFDLLAANETPFAIWDGRAFHLRRR